MEKLVGAEKKEGAIEEEKRRYVWDLKKEERFLDRKEIWNGNCEKGRGDFTLSEMG